MTKTKELSIEDLPDMRREELIDALLHFPGTFEFDFTRECLDAYSDSQLRHTLMAAFIFAHQER
jgi:hypothetical protein